MGKNNSTRRDGNFAEERPNDSTTNDYTESMQGRRLGVPEGLDFGRYKLANPSSGP